MFESFFEELVIKSPNGVWNIFGGKLSWDLKQLYVMIQILRGVEILPVVYLYYIYLCFNYSNHVSLLVAFQEKGSRDLWFGIVEVKEDFVSELLMIFDIC
ncbi:hypothetical protein VIGAN_05279300 [Vigna angularis var. angularis]|uniref:Uncharacterized protein n=1 Tax=Vigna angularis var. angularis TaxID=157739 RepID=A0A0S3S8D5_PHAAN|nr:hypothetical protein VIGAN_05279300 [Vigna angularis var. angularis]